MSKRRMQTGGEPSKEAVRLLEPARGVTDPNDARIQQVAKQILTLAQAEQVAIAQWMGSQPEYAGVIACLLGRIGVSGALRRALKRALFDLRRQGVEATVSVVSSEEREAPDRSWDWSVTEAYASLFHLWDFASQESMHPVHLRFFMQHSSGERAVFIVAISATGKLDYAHLIEGGVRELHQQCVDNRYRPMKTGDPNEMPLVSRFVAVPIEWAVQLAHEARQRNLCDHLQMPPHAAFYWGRLHEPPDPPVPMPIDSIPDAETGWLVSSLITSERPREVPVPVVVFLSYFAPPPELLVQYISEVMNESESQLVLPSSTEEERRKRDIEKVMQRLFSGEEPSKALKWSLPVLGSIALLGGERQTAVWCKALWREFTDRTDRPFWQTKSAELLMAIAYQLLNEEVRLHQEGNRS